MSLTINNSTRISGLASGLETDTIVEGLLAQYQQKLDRQSQKTTKLEWTAEAYRGINTLIKNFREQYLSALSATNMMTGTAYSDFKVNMLTENGAVSITASPYAVAGEYTIESIDQLAAAASIESREVFTGAKYDSETTLSKLELANKFEFDENGELSFSVNGKTFTFNKDTTVSEMMRQVNNSGAGVTMRFSTLKKGFSLTGDKTGSQSEIKIVNLKGNAFSAEDGALGISEGVYNGKDAICTIEGMPVTQSTNSFSYDGITYNLTAESDTPIKFSVEQDYEKTVDSIVKFVDAYNELVEALQSKVSEKVYTKYTPLTDAQRKEMKEDEIANWEKYAKSGTLHNDSYVTSLLSELRGAFYANTEGLSKSLYDIGLTTGTWQEGAKIKVDKEKLLESLKEDPQTVKQIFVQTADEGGYSEKGLMLRISDALLTYTKNSTDIALDSLEDRITESKDAVTSLTQKMEDKETDLWKKFSVMEAALSKLNSLSSWLASLFES